MYVLIPPHRKAKWPSWGNWVLGTLLILSVTSTAWWCFCRPGTYGYFNFLRIQVGMDLEQVERLLGPGTELLPSHVPLQGLRPVVTGGHVFQWKNPRSGGYILVAFNDGKVCEKNYWEPNYF